MWMMSIYSMNNETLSKYVLKFNFCKINTRSNNKPGEFHKELSRLIALAGLNHPISNSRL